MTAKEYLSQIPRLKLCIKALEESYDQAKARATKTTQRHDEIKVQSSGGHHRQEDMVLKMVELSEKIDEAVKGMIDLQEEALEIIMKMDDPKERTVLIQRYINGKSWVAVTCDVYQTTIDDEDIDSKLRNTHYIHKRALSSFSLFFM